MSDLQTIRLKPNPAGKDRTRFGASQTQLGAEWVDIKNISGRPLPVAGIKVFHVAYSGAYDSGTWEEVSAFTSGSIGVGQVVRIHSGSGPMNVLRTDDLQGADIHLFTHKNRYVWNNDRGDCSAIGPTDRQLTDQAWYDPYPPEGEILQRLGNKLVPSRIAAGRRY